MIMYDGVVEGERPLHAAELRLGSLIQLLI